MINRTDLGMFHSISLTTEIIEVTREHYWAGRAISVFVTISSM